MRIIGIGGEPATGKTTMIRQFMNSLGGLPFWKTFKVGLVIGHIDPMARVGIFGSYSGHTFDGPDRMSMAVQPKVSEFLLKASKQKDLEGYTWIFEGDRLFNPSFIQFTKTLPATHVYCILEASEEAKARRHRQREDNQPETFLKAKATKLANIKAKFPEVEVLRHESPEDTASIVDWIQRHVEEEKQAARP